MNRREKQPQHWDMELVLKQKAIHLQTCISSPFSIPQFQLRSKWLTIMMRATEASSELIDRNISNDLFYVFYLLGTRWISHQLASHDLLINGQYGEVIALHRMLFEVTDRITYFHLHPEDANRWRSWSAHDPETTTKEYKADRNYFSQSQIVKKIKAKEITPASIDFQRLSAAIHPNEWGTQYYAHRSPNYGEISLEYGPRFDFRKAFWLGLVANQVLTHPIISFLNICRQTRAPKSLWRWVQVKYEENLPNWEREMRIGKDVNDSMAVIEQRISSGESMEKIGAEIEKQYKEAQEKQDH